MLGVEVLVGWSWLLGGSWIVEAEEERVVEIGGEICGMHSGLSPPCSLGCWF